MHLYSYFGARGGISDGGFSFYWGSSCSFSVYSVFFSFDGMRGDSSEFYSESTTYFSVTSSSLSTS